MKKIIVLLTGTLFITSLIPGCTEMPIDVLSEFLQKSKNFPAILRLYGEGMFDSVVVNNPDGLVLLRFHSFEDSISNYTYFAWSRSDKVPLEGLDGLFWVSITKVGFTLRYAEIFQADRIMIPPEGIILDEGPNISPVVSSVAVEGEPIIINSSEGIESLGDLWMNTWADDDHLYSGWGDGNGFGKTYTDMGVAQLIGNLPNITGENIKLDSSPENNKPSSLLFYNGTLYAQIHSPLGNADVGYLAYSNDYGKTWAMLRETSPWTKEVDSNFRCLFFINMGQNYSLNTDGYVYALGIGREWAWSGEIYLARVSKDHILDYDSYEYFVNITENEPQWSDNQFDAKPLQGIVTRDQISAMYHPLIDRYIILNAEYVYDAPNPWGPWCYAGKWTRYGWYGYQPGIISKDVGADYFWFTIAGQTSPHEGGVTYQLNLGKMIMSLR